VNRSIHPALHAAASRTAWGLLASSAILATVGGCASGLDEVTVDDNPNSTLSCYVRWTTAEAATSRVEFGLDAPDQFFVEDLAETTDHELLVIGMKPLSTYQLQAASLTAGGDDLRSEVLTYDTGATPFADLVTTVTAYDPEAVEPGWTLSNVVVNSVNYPPTAVIYDWDGDPIWYYRHGDDNGRADIEVTLVDESHVLLGAGMASYTTPVEVDLAGNVTWTGPEQPLDDQFLTPDVMHHTFQKLPGGDYITLVYNRNANGDIFDYIWRFDAELNTTWDWVSDNYIKNDYDEYPWGNMVVVDEAADVVYYNARAVSMLHKLQRSTGEVQWRFGEGGDFAPDPDAEYPFVTEAHAPELQPDGHILYYDNGGFTRDYSRVIEYELDTDAMTSTIVWEYPGELADDPWQTYAMGDADRLPNGNTLVSAGSLIATDSISRLMEITPDGEMAWMLEVTGSGGDLAGQHMVERIPVLVGEL
jgi:hypothetical protein